MRPPEAPPRLAAWVVGRLAGSDFADPVLGDLAEEFAERIDSGVTPAAARRWYWAEAFMMMRPSVLRDLRLGYRAAGGSLRKEVGTMLGQDIRFAWRGIRGSPGFAVMAVATIALGIGGTAAVFSAMDGFVLRPFPFPDQARLVTVGSAHPKTGRELSFFEHLSPAEYLDVKATGSVEKVVAWDLGNRQVTVGETTENLFTAFWWGDAFATIGLPPHFGRGFSEDEMARGDRVAVISHRVWRDRFGADSALVGGKILVNGEPYTVVGIMPARALVYGSDLWIPFPARPEQIPRDRRMLQVLARLVPGATIESFGAELEGLARRTEQDHGAAMPEYAGWRLVPSTWADANVQQLKPAALAMLGAIIFVMLLVCTNVATLLLGRSAARAREFALRGALGASRGRLLRQLLTESLVLSLAGAVAGVGLGYFGILGINRVLNSLPISLFEDLRLNGLVLAATVAVAVVAGLGFGTLPALHILRSDLRGTLQAGAALGGTRSRLRIQRSLIGVEAALALTLLAASGYLLRSLAAMRAIDPGFEPERVLTIRVTLARERYRPAAVEPFFQTVRERVGAIPGVLAVASASQFPPNLYGRAEFGIEGGPAATEGAKPFAFLTVASPEYFATLAVPLRKGRLLGPTDRDGTPRVVVVNDVVAARYFPGLDPVGRRIKVGDPDDPWAEIVGVVGATRNRGLDQEPAPELFIASTQVPGWNNQMFLMVRTAADPRAVLGSIRAAVKAIDPDQPIYAVRTIEETYQQTQLVRRLSVVVFTVFGGVALLIAVVGLYGVVSYATTQRAREIGVRVALGAARSAVTGLFVRQAMVPVLIGASVGLVAAWGIGMTMASLLFQVRPGDVVTLGGAAAVLVAAGVVASFVPAFGASRVDPATTLREE